MAISEARKKREIEIAQKLLGNVKIKDNEGDNLSITGELVLFTSHGSNLGTFEVEIVYHEFFGINNSPPHVYLVNKRESWQKGGESHIEDDWRVCLYVPSESKINFRNVDSLVLLIERIASFFAQESLFQDRLAGDKDASWVGPARSHGTPGLAETLVRADKSLVKLRKKDPCPCGSGLRSERCHKMLLNKKYIRAATT